jgi:hypothetical protein
MRCIGSLEIFRSVAREVEYLPGCGRRQQRRDSFEPVRDLRAQCLLESRAERNSIADDYVAQPLIAPSEHLGDEQGQPIAVVIQIVQQALPGRTVVPAGIELRPRRAHMQRVCAFDQPGHRAQLHRHRRLPHP